MWADGAGDIEPASQLRRIDLRNFLLAQAGRVLDDFWGPRPGQDQPYFFQVVAQAFLDAADRIQPARCSLAEDIQARVVVAEKGIRLLGVQDVYVDAEGPGNSRQPVKFEVNAAASMLENDARAAVFVSETGPPGRKPPSVLFCQAGRARGVAGA